MEQYFLSLIRTFLSTTEYADTEMPIFEMVFTDNIYAYVLQDDPEYAKRIKADTTYGIYYVTKMCEQQLVIENTVNVIEIMHNLFHEVIHIFDFNSLAKYKNNYNIRELQDDTFFVLWSEFHAEYCSYKYFIEHAKDNFSPQQVQTEFQENLNDFMNRHAKLEIQNVADFCVRLYGQHIALYDVFKNVVDKYPREFFINQDFLNLYDYLNEHKHFERIKNDLGNLAVMFKRLELH